MAATIEKSLYIGILKTRFDVYDNVKLRLKSGEIVEGEIIELGDTVVCLELKNGKCSTIFVDDIKDYVV